MGCIKLSIESTSMVLRKIFVSQREQVNKPGQDCITIGYAFCSPYPLFSE
jgi:hypothetical protein